MNLHVLRLICLQVLKNKRKTRTTVGAPLHRRVFHRRTMPITTVEPALFGRPIRERPLHGRNRHQKQTEDKH